MTDRFGKLLRAFGDGVVAQDREILGGDAERGNAHAKQYIAAMDGMIGQGEEGIAAAATLLLDERMNVRVMAASMLIEHRETDAVAVLEKESEGRGLTAFGAAQALSRWKKRAGRAIKPSPERRGKSAAVKTATKARSEPRGKK